MANSQLSCLAAICNVQGKNTPSFYNQRGFSTVARTSGQARGLYDLTMDPDTFGELHTTELAILVNQNIQNSVFCTVNWYVVDATTIRIQIKKGSGETMQLADADFSIVIYRVN